ncbi:MAG: DUF1080 domain-containing protein [Verrucomicrobiales bacterium]|nr:DUF1080 domain-containing protein [Verrucomicrobiales bacterium]
MKPILPDAARLLVPILWSLTVGTLSAATPVDGWSDLFDGRTLEGWRGNEGGASHKVVDGAIVCDGPRSHLFYVGAVEDGQFGDFEFEVEVRTSPGANSGIYFHTAFQEKDWPTQGYEVQVNNTATGEGGYRENKKTGSLYGIRNVYRQLVADNEWFRLRISVLGRQVRIWVNDTESVNYVEPRHAPNGGYKDRRISRGTFALQCHDPGSKVSFRRIRVRPLKGPSMADANLGDAYAIPAGLSQLFADNVPVIDLHTHLKGGLTMADILQRQFRTGINAGVALNCGVGFPVTNDAGIDRVLGEFRHPLVFTGMQAEGREWVTLFSKEAVAKFDYVFTDAMTIFDDNGKRMRLWIPEEVEVTDPQLFMDLLVRRTIQILESEPIDIWVNPTFLPAVIAGDYARLWTPERMNKVIEVAARKGVAIEINDRFRLPSLDFLRLAKAAGVKFTLGTNNGGREDLGRLDHSVQMIREVGLQWQDFWMPGRRRP